MHNFSRAHFIGIGGIGMSALAQMLRAEGVEVSGSDREEGPVCDLLAAKGIRVAVPQRAENVPDAADVVVYSDAVPEDNPERVRARELGIPEFSYFSMLGKVSKERRTVAVSGTHGKTTTTGMLAKILIDADADPTVIVGSLLKDFGGNYISGHADLFVVEACEYRDHLLELSPEVLIITNIEWDHTDWFPSLAAMQETFRKAMANVPAEGFIITDPANPNIAPLLSQGRTGQARVVDYTKEEVPELKLPGEFNRANARAAAAAARCVLPNISNEKIHAALASFSGSWRRFEYKGKTASGADVYDDYAHHPTAVAATLAALRDKTSGRLCAVFQPHLYSRTRDLLEEFAGAFTDADMVFVAPIYAAREKDDGSISHETLAQALRKRGIHALAVPDFAAARKELSQCGAGDTVICLGAGDIYTLADALVSFSV